MAQLDSDAFTYSNGALPTVSGGKWATMTGMGGGVPVVSNRLQGSGGEAAATIVTWAGSTTLQWSECVWISGDFGGPTIFSDGVGSFYVLDVSGSSTSIYKVISGGFTAIVTGGAAPTSGRTYRLAMSVAGTLVATENGVTILTQASEFSLTTGKPGIRAWGTVLDDWAAGDFSGGGAKATVQYDQMRRA